MRRKFLYVFPYCNLLSAVPIIGQHPGGGVVYIAALPLLVWHPEIHHHLALAGVVFLEDVPVEQRLFCKGLGVGVGFSPPFKGCLLYTSDAADE